MIKILITFLTLIILNEISEAQVKCQYCGKEISGGYIEAEGQKFHPEHFLCSECKKVITDGYNFDKNKFYHPECLAELTGLRCSTCQKVISGGYIQFEGKNYHQECFEENVQKKCTICRKPISGTYEVDLFGNEFHPEHRSEYPECDGCNRLACDALTGGYKKYADGRYVCKICYQNAVLDDGFIAGLLTKVMNKLSSMGLIINSSKLSIRGVDRTGLRKFAGANYSEEMRGFCDTRTSSRYVNGKLSGESTEHTIYVLNGVPATSVESVIAHELMHVWLIQNTRNDHSAHLREGSCNFISFIYLSSLAVEDAKIQMKIIEMNPDSVYGDGFRMVREKFGKRNISDLLKYLKNNRN